LVALAVAVAVEVEKKRLRQLQLVLVLVVEAVEAVVVEVLRLIFKERLLRTKF
jgi:hypothetical protein